MFDLLIEYLLRFKKKLISIPFIKRALKIVDHRTQNEAFFSGLYQHERMLADKIRIESYFNAINKYVKEGDVVVDLGTGSGILSFFAHFKNPRKIYAIDHSNIIEKAKLVAERNGISGIQFIRSNSQNLTLPEKADVIVQEQMGSWLFDENMIENVLDLRDRVLKKGGCL
jgi:protein arginine N-methyltransferase 1